MLTDVKTMCDDGISRVPPIERQRTIRNNARMIHHRRAVVGLALLLSSLTVIGCRGVATAPPTTSPSHLSDAPPTSIGQTFIRTTLFFGLARRDAANVTETQWQTFVDTEVTPRFPDGLTVLPASGQWKGDDGQLVREPSRLLILFYPPSPDAHAKIETIRRRYCEQFTQDAVLRADATERVSF